MEGPFRSQITEGKLLLRLVVDTFTVLPDGIDRIWSVVYSCG